METFDFAEALHRIEWCGSTVMGPGNRAYKIVDGKVICFPKPESRPKQWRVEIKFSTEAILYKGWYICEIPSEQKVQ